MKTEFRKAILPKDLNRLVAFDHKVFTKADWFRKSDWGNCESYWMIVDGATVGCCGFEHSKDFQEKQNSLLRNSLYISTSGILPRFQRKGIGRLLKSWQIAYARRYGFDRIITNHRASNRGIIELNKKFGFKIVRRCTVIYYDDPPESMVVMELKLRDSATCNGFEALFKMTEWIGTTSFSP
jgi:ribosomal protein S18 acetylase RimI-like enzyme